MAGVGLKLQVLVDDEARLVIEESHFGRAAVWICGLLLGGTFVAPGVLSGSIEMFIISIVLGTIVVGLPFLLVLAWSKYRRLEVRPGTELVSETVYRLRRPRLVRVSWDEIARVVCERQRDSSPNPGRLVLTLHTVDGSELRLLAGWYSHDVKAILHRRLGDKFSAVETSAPLWGVR